MIFNLWLAVIGGLIVFGGIYGLALEPSTAPGGDHGGDGHGDHEPDGPDVSAADGDDSVPGDHVPDDHEVAAVD